MLEIAVSIHEKALFILGKVVSTPGATNALQPHPGRLKELVARHASGDFGCIRKSNDRNDDYAVKDGVWILSAFPIDPNQPSKGYGNNSVWIITEADRSQTTVLLPEEVGHVI